jgi:hypothetical protein
MSLSTPDLVALIAMLRQMQSEPLSFSSHMVSGTAERAADALERLSPEPSAQRCACGTFVIPDGALSVDDARNVIHFRHQPCFVREPAPKPVRIHGLCDKHMHIGHFPAETASLPMPPIETVCPWCERKQPETKNGDAP